MGFELTAPAWLLLLIPAAILLIRFADFRKKSAMILRITGILCVILALAQPRLIFPQPGSILVIAADRSGSMPENAGDHQKEVIRILEKQRGKFDRAGVVSFAEHSYAEKLPDLSNFEKFQAFYTGTATRLGDALEAATALIPEGRNGRILLLSDGRATDPDWMDAVMFAAGRGIPIDYHLQERPPVNDLAILSLTPPVLAEKGEHFRFSAELLVPEDMEITYSLKCGRRELASGTLSLSAGRRTLSFSDRLEHPGSFCYSLTVNPIQQGLDPVPQNNTARAFTTVKGSKPLLIAGDARSRLAALAHAGGLEVYTCAPGRMQWTVENLSKFSGVVLENVPTQIIGYQGQTAIRTFVGQGGALLVTGGRQSFGVGGYFNSPLDSLLPVSMELRNDQKRLTNAVVVALDRSGSMTMTAEDGRTKMELANAGTAALVDLLMNGDRLAVLAVDSKSHIVVPPGSIAESDKPDLKKKIMSIQSMGGGIFIYEALNHAAEIMAELNAGTKHIVLFADASDSEEPGEYRKLLDKLRDAGITVSVIGLGTPNDSDAELLKEIARLGGGNIYFSKSGMDLPQIFAQEAISVLRNAFVTEPVKVRKAEDLPLLMQVPQGDVPNLGGYNLTYLRPNASAALISDDENHAPLLAFWSHGAGKVMAMTFETDGKYTGDFGTWNYAGELLLSSLRWLSARGEDPSTDPKNPLCAVTENHGSTLSTRIELDPERTQNPFTAQPVMIAGYQETAGAREVRIPFRWKDRDTLSAEIPVASEGTVTLMAEIPDRTLKDGMRYLHCGMFTPIYPPEYRPETDLTRGKRILERAAMLSGGSIRMDLNHLYDTKNPRKVLFPFWHILAFLAAVILLLEVAVLRIGDFLARRKRQESSPEPEVRGKGKKRKKTAAEVPAKSAEEIAEPSPGPESPTLSRALQEAKSKGKRHF